MAESNEGAGSSNMHLIIHPSEETSDGRQGLQLHGLEEELFSPIELVSSVSSLDSLEALEGEEEEDLEEQHEQQPRVLLALDRGQEEQIEKLKEFLSEAKIRGDDYVRQSDADTVKSLEKLRIRMDSDVGLGARLESAARINLEIQKQAGAGYFPSETVYLQEQTLKEVLDEAGPELAVTISSMGANYQSSSATASPIKSPRSVDADDALKNELDCLFQERAARFRLE